MKAPKQTEKVTDDNALRLAQDGDAVAFEHIYRLHNRKVYSLCLRMVEDPTDAEDLTHLFAVIP